MSSHQIKYNEALMEKLPLKKHQKALIAANGYCEAANDGSFHQSAEDFMHEFWQDAGYNFDSVHGRVGTDHMEHALQSPNQKKTTPNSGAGSKTATKQHEAAAVQKAKTTAVPAKSPGFFSHGGGGPELLDLAKGIAGSVADDFTKDWEHFKEDLTKPNDFGDHAKPKTMALPPKSRYQKYNGFMEKHDFVGSIAGISSIPGTAKTMKDIYKGSLKVIPSGLHSVKHVAEGGWNYAKDLHVNYSSNGMAAGYTYIQSDGVINTGTAELSTIASQRSAQVSQYVIRSSISSAVKSGLTWGPVMAVAGDMFLCAMDRYDGVTDGICSSPAKFGANIALDIPKAMGSGIVGGVSGSSISLLTIMMAEGLVGAELGGVVGPIGSVVGLLTGFGAGWWTGSKIEDVYIEHHLKSDLSNYLERRI